MKLMLLAAAAAVALALAGAAAADQTYTDATGEVANSADISTVAVSNNPTAGTITFVVTTNYTTPFDANASFGILMDSDNNSSTGLVGFDYLLVVDNTGAAAVNATTLGVVAETQSSVANGVWTITVPVADIGSPTGQINFGVITDVGPDPNNPFEDVAPDNGLWTYQMVAPPPPPPPPAPAPVTIDSVAVTSAGAPTHGKAFRITKLEVDLSNGVVTKATSLKCSATLGGAHLAGTGAGGCTYHLPATSKGKKLSVKVSGKYKSKTLAKTASFTVK